MDQWPHLSTLTVPYCEWCQPGTTACVRNAPKKYETTAGVVNTQPRIRCLGCKEKARRA